MRTRYGLQQDEYEVIRTDTDVPPRVDDLENVAPRDKHHPGRFVPVFHELRLSTRYQVSSPFRSSSHMWSECIGRVSRFTGIIGWRMHRMADYHSIHPDTNSHSQYKLSLVSWMPTFLAVGILRKRRICHGSIDVDKVQKGGHRVVTAEN